MEILWMLLLLMAAGGLYMGARWRSMVLELRELRAIVNATPEQSTTINPNMSLRTIEATPIPGAGLALAKPPTDYRLVLDALQSKGEGKYRIPLGWYTSAEGARLQTAQLVGDVNHILITGQSDSGKDNMVLNMLLALTQQHTPQAVQFAIVDGKGLDWMDWEGRAHTWLLATDPEHIGGAMKALSAERQRRREILAAAGAKKWDVYKGNDLPLLVVYVAELLLLQNATSKSELTGWLNAELTAARAFGIRYIIGAQNASNFDTQWRSQISLYLAGYQPLPSSDAPNIGMSASDAEALKVTAPSRLPAPSTGAAGVFCAVQGGQGVNVRTTLIPDAQAEYLVRQLPIKALHSVATDRSSRVTSDPSVTKMEQESNPVLKALLTGKPLPFEDDRVAGATGHSNAPKSGATRLGSGSALASVGRNNEALPVAPDLIPAEEQRAILELAKQVNSRRAICKQLYDGATGGKAYAKVQAVCDAAGLLMPPGPPQAVAA